MNGYQALALRCGDTQSIGAPVFQPFMPRAKSMLRVIRPDRASILLQNGSAIEVGSPADLSRIGLVVMIGGRPVSKGVLGANPGVTVGRDDVIVGWRFVDGTTLAPRRAARVLIYGGRVEYLRDEMFGVVPPYQVVQSQNAGIPPGQIPPWYAIQYPAGYVPPLLVSVDNPLEPDPFDAFDEIRFRGERERRDLVRSHILPGSNVPTYLGGYAILGGLMDDNPLVVSPGYIVDRMNRLNSAMMTFQKDVWRELPGPTQPFSLAFGAFKVQWDKFYSDNGPGISGWLSRLSGSTMDSVINYERRLDEWKDRFRAEVAAKGRGAGLSAPSRDPVTDPTQPQKKPEGEWSSALLKALGLIAIGVALYAGGRYIIYPFLVSRVPGLR